MTNKSILKMALVTFSLIFVCSLGTYAQKNDCSKANDGKITDAANAVVRVLYEDQLTHISIQVKDKVATITGWVTTKEIRKDIENIVKKTPCVSKVVNKLTTGIGGGCPDGTQPCNGTCIPNSETCSGKGKGN